MRKIFENTKIIETYVNQCFACQYVKAPLSANATDDERVQATWGDDESRRFYEELVLISFRFVLLNIVFEFW